MIVFRNILFWIGFLIITPILFIVMLCAAPLPPRIRHYTGVAWARSVLWLLKHAIGLSYQVEGRENIPKEPSIICCKHQSGYETLALQSIFPHQIFVLKKELLYLPILGQGLMLMSPIPIDRKEAVQASQKLLEIGLKRKKLGFWISIFPEGTRTQPGVRGRYKRGAARMAQNLQMNIVPVAMNSGEFWSRRLKLLQPGIVHFVILPTIAWDSDSVEKIAQKYEDVIETAQKEIEGQGPFFIQQK
ncbi:MAG: 1-acyl-sn-glycerol-3-phosphate acyltransferase [Neisseriaceae bacterium]|nr:1-acyl-sn-glycerol-3-phosphate acyltransferase [Neisseriaceae bacterium]